MPLERGSARVAQRRRHQGPDKPQGRVRQGSRVLISKDGWERIRKELSLSSREVEVVQHVFEGQKLQTVAWEMGLSLGTVKTYIERIHRKLRISNQRELILAVLDVHLRSEASSARESSGD